MTRDKTRSDAAFGPVSGEDMAEWSDFLRDDNAIHLRRDAAEAAGFGPRRVNPGPANLAYVLSAAMTENPSAEFAEITARFLGNVFEGDLLTIRMRDQGGPCAAKLRAQDRDTPVLDIQFTLKESS